MSTSGKVHVMTHPIVNLIAFQLNWFAACLGAANGLPYLGPAFATLWLPLHLMSTRPRHRIEFKLLIIAALMGYTLDSLLVLGGWLGFPERAQLGAPSTLWMVTLWMGFAATLRHVLGWLRHRYVLAAVLGAVFGPLAYWGGAQLGAVNLGESAYALLAVAVEWSIAMPVLLLVANRLERTNGSLFVDNRAHKLQQGSSG